MLYEVITCFEALVTIPGIGTLTCTQCVHVEPPFDNIQLSIPEDNVGMMGQTVNVPIDLLNQLALPMKDFTITRITSYNVCYTKLLRRRTSEATQNDAPTGNHTEAARRARTRNNFV